MFDPEPSFRPVRWRDGYRPLEDLGLIGGGATVAEESWRIVEPVLAAWSKDLVPLEEYPAGSHGPRPEGEGFMRSVVVRAFGEPLVTEDRPGAIDDVLNGTAKARLVLAP